MRSPDQPRVTFDGFKREVGRIESPLRLSNLSQEFEKVKRTLEEYFSVKVEHRDTSLKGWNWGKATVQSKLDCLIVLLTDRQRSRFRGSAQDRL